jgi:4a-hydroxytetrahydrobiopterin dehydratase
MWIEKDKALEQVFQFKNFTQAFAFMTQVAFIAEKLNHHPDWSNVYNKVVIRLSTHESGAVTDKDFRMAEAIDQLLK